MIAIQAVNLGYWQEVLRKVCEPEQEASLVSVSSTTPRQNTLGVLSFHLTLLRMIYCLSCPQAPD